MGSACIFHCKWWQRPYGRRSSFNKEKTDPQPLESPVEPGISQYRPTPNGLVPSQTNQQPSSPRLINSQQSHDVKANAVLTQTQPANGPAVVPNDPVAEAQRMEAARKVQREMMREKRELAIKRKKEEEEREEAAKKERIRIKLEKLGLPPLEAKQADQKKNEKQEAEPQQAVTKETTPSIPATVSLTPEVATSAEVQSPPKPPVPDSTGAPRQYGMMKVHGPALANGISPNNERAVIGEEARVHAANQRVPPLEADTVPQSEERLPSPMVNGDLAKSRHGPRDLPLQKLATSICTDNNGNNHGTMCRAKTNHTQQAGVLGA